MGVIALLSGGVGALIGATDPDAVQAEWSRLDASLAELSADVGRLALELLGVADA